MWRGPKHSKIEVVAPEEEEVCLHDYNNQPRQSTRFLQQVNTMSNDRKTWSYDLCMLRLRTTDEYSLTYLLVEVEFFSTAVPEHQNVQDVYRDEKITLFES
jgi:hypothetical protein